MRVLATIQEGNKCSVETKVKADVFLHQHIDEMLEFEYSNCDDPSILWKDLETRSNNQMEVLLPFARDEWNNLRLQDLKSNNTDYKVLKGSLALPEANAVNNNDNKNSGSKRGRGGYNGRGRGRRRGCGQRNNTYHAPQVNNLNQQNNEVGNLQNPEGSCFRCGSANHWSKACRTLSHLFKEKYCDPGIFSLWHNRLSHPGSTMMKRIVENTHGHPLKNQKFPKEDKVPLCTSCSLGKLIARPSPLKVENESPMFLERIQGDIDEIFSYSIASDIMSGDDDPEPKSVIDCRSRPDWDKWKDAMIDKEIQEVIVLLKKKFEMKDLGKTKYCIGLQIEHMHNGIITNQSNYTEKLFKRFNMDKAKPLSTQMVGRSLNVDNDPFRPCEDDEEVLGPEVPYLSAIGALMYLTNYTRSDISFAVNLLARFSSSPTKGTGMESNTFFDIFEEPSI
nr:retrovirus-related Pol polyprotein from transposon TNT 1-94 [Tanacetum cinerariifolium]